MELGKLESKEIYNLSSILKKIELDKLEWDEIYTLIFYSERVRTR